MKASFLPPVGKNVPRGLLLTVGNKAINCYAVDNLSRTDTGSNVEASLGLGGSGGARGYEQCLTLLMNEDCRYIYTCDISSIIQKLACSQSPIGGSCLLIFMIL